ncbi:MAG TPA: hypothetical protein VGV90_01865 [Solirubrobacteraceae bacterium]|nr:hypothetical protein [Solirubrobacteraceae bacterium]
MCALGTVAFARVAAQQILTMSGDVDAVNSKEDDTRCARSTKSGQRAMP